MDYLIRFTGDPIANFAGRKLPTIKEVISLFLYQTKVIKLQYTPSLNITINKVQEVWSQANIPTCGKEYAIKKLKKILVDGRKLLKSYKRKNSATQKKNESLFSQKIKKLFDIAKLNVERYIDKDKKLFLADQRARRRFGLFDHTAPSTSENENEDDVVVESVDMNELDSGVTLVSQKSAISLSELSTTTGSQTSNAVSDFESQLSQSNQMNKINVMTPELSAALDRAKVSSRNATYILAAAYKSVGINLSTLNLSHSTIHRGRIKLRTDIAEDLKTEFQIDDRYVVHWDSKVLCDIADTKSVDRIAIILSVSGVDQLLGVPKADSGTADQQASAVIATLDQWKVAPYVKAMCFDTPAVNTGVHKGTCVLIEKALDRKLVWLPCRHHIMEIILRGVFEVFWNTTTGPNAPIFVRFKKDWDNIDQSKYKSGMQDGTVAQILNEERSEILTFINNCLQISQPRDDYRELLLLSLIFLDSSPADTVSFKRPGAMHHARWMAKAIYSLKIFMFRDEFSLTIREKNSLRQVCIFVILFYIKVWYTSTSAILAPNNDLEFIKKLISFKNTNPKVSQEACRKMIEHLWYLNEELVTISLFDDNVSVAVKRKMVEAIKNRESSSKMNQRYTVVGNELELLLEKDLSEFVSKNSLELFKKFDLPYDFLEKDISTWSSDDSYNESSAFFKKLKVTNDVAERGVALIEEYNKCLTKDEQQLQYLLQTVREHRRRHPNCSKGNL